MFETTTTLDLDMLKKIAANHMAPWKKYILYAVGALCACFVFVGIADRDYLGSVICFAAAAVIAYSLFLKPRKWVEAQCDAIVRSGSKSFRYTTSFGEDCVHVENETTGWTGTLQYEALAFLYDIGEAYVLFTAGGQYVIVGKAQLGQERCTKFIHFLQHRKTAIKWKRTRVKESVPSSEAR